MESYTVNHYHVLYLHHPGEPSQKSLYTKVPYREH
jgi:hypothetical protein